jgi:hypothetical protein
MAVASPQGDGMLEIMAEAPGHLSDKSPCSGAIIASWCGGLQDENWVEQIPG